MDISMSCVYLNFFMENGTVLERMSFSLASQELGKSKVMEDFKENLFSFKKGFSFAVVEFSYDQVNEASSINLQCFLINVFCSVNLYMQVIVQR